MILHDDTNMRKDVIKKCVRVCVDKIIGFLHVMLKYKVLSRKK